MTLINEQLDLFGNIVPEIRQFMCCPHCSGKGIISVNEATARTADPRSSKEAGDRHSSDPRRFKRGSRQALVLEAFAREPYTAQEVAIAVVGIGAPISALEGTRRRVSSLKRIGLIAETGQERVNPGSATPSSVYGVTDLGREVLDRLLSTGWSV
jgi:hypothetical protein